MEKPNARLLQQLAAALKYGNQSRRFPFEKLDLRRVCQSRPFLRIRRVSGGIAVSIFICYNPPNILRSKKAITHRRDITAMSMN